METDIAFNWPEPGEGFWLATGAQLGLDESVIKFAAALHSLGGADAKKNTQAARVTGLTLDRTQAFRLARSVGVRKLLDEANKIKSGRRPPVSEAEVDARIDDLIRAPDALTVARGIELREKRRAAKKEAAEADDDPLLLDCRIARVHLSRPHGASSFMLFWRGIRGQFGHPELYPLLHDVYHLAMREEPFGRAIWEWACAPLSDVMREALNSHLADPSWQLAERIKIWRELGKQPPGPIPGTPLETTNAQ